MDATNEYGKWWFLSGSLESITAALQNIVSVTSSTRDLLSGCFNCGFQASCFKKREAVANKGAWFDCEQIPVDFPHCYENQITLEVTNDDCISHCSSQISHANHVSRECNGILAATSPTLKIDDNLCMSEVKLNESLASKSDTCLDDADCPLQNNAKFNKYKKGFIDPSSFVYKLEQDHFDYKNDSLRSDGQTLSPQFKRSKSERSCHKPIIRSPILERASVSSSASLDLESFDWDEDSLTSADEECNSVVIGDIWKPNELEGVFETYNAATLYSLECTATIQPKTYNPTNFKTSEKYEEVFPPLLTKKDPLLVPKIEKEYAVIEQNNNKPFILKLNNDKSKCQLKAVCDEDLENERFIENQNCLEVTTEELKQFITTCRSMEDNDQKDLSQKHLIINNFSCDKSLIYCGKSFNLKLIYDLVTEANWEYLLQYNHSSIFIPNYCLSIIIDKVLSTINFDKYCKPYQLSLLEDIEKLKKKMLLYNNLIESAKVPDEILIENVTADEIIKEGRLWQNVDAEEKELKNKISKEIFDDLLNKELLKIRKIFNKKLTFK